MVTDGLEALTLDHIYGTSLTARIRRAIADCNCERTSARQRRVLDEATNWDGKTMKALFRKASSKFQNNTVRRLNPVPGCQARDVHAKAEIFADAWSPILQQPVRRPDTQADVAAWIEQVIEMTPDQEAVAAELTETEVPAAFADCKTGKANGPDLLGNNWYRRSVPLLIPIFTILLNQWYLDGVFPPSFLEANIFCGEPE
ncbi:hypothetical protein PI124_g20596 [Phytophthora idaei]|nr:hypothetical protein PI125_g22033 [Phytophthora idaei]KAG3129694.1 hypothetical protein PI126_g20849 [Phytophthora idaei]KAG3234347.1 hypothetical protein PI124_g20596 [Phytophthora idaei]